MNQIKTLDFNGEKMAFFTFIDPNNRNMEVTEWHHRVHYKLNIPINYFQIDYRLINHGGAMEKSIALFKNQIDYFCFIDNDCLLLRKEVPQEIYEKLKDKRTIFGGSQNSNHIHTNPTHPFVQPSSFCISTELYEKLGSPHLADYIKRSDTCEEATWLCQERGYNVCMVYPSHYNELTDEEIKTSGNPKKWNLTNTLFYGLGTTYGDTFFHAGMQSLPRSAELLISKAKEIINKSKKIEAIIVCKNYSDYLSLTLPKNRSYFDEIYVVSDKNDLNTKKICEIYDARFIEYNQFNKNGAIFNKGGAIQEAINNLKYKDWVVFLDCDIIIKEPFKDKLTDVNKFYGSYRRFIPTLKDYQNINTNKPENFEAIEGSGCGFFQCVNFNHPSFKAGAYYPDSYSAEQVDIDFLKMFCPFVNNEYKKLERMGIELWHLGSHGINNNGRSEKDNFFK